MKIVRWGVLSTARIGLEKVIPAMRKSARIEVAAIASRDIAAARRAAEGLGIPKAYGSYEELLSDPAIDAIYNPLPNHLHVPLTLEAARAGKHVLCEKPMGMNAGEIDALDGCRVQVMEAFMVRHSAQWNAARDVIRAGGIGAPMMIQSFFSYDNRDPGNIRNRLEYGGGALMDIGCYPVVAGRFFFEADPVRVMALIGRSAEFGTDAVTSGLIDFGGGRQLTFAVSTQLAPSQGITVFGTKARLSIQVPYNAQTDAPNVFTVDDGSRLDGGSAQRHEMEVSDQYARMAEDFSRAVLGEIAPPYGLDDARVNMRVIDALFRSEKSGGWEKP